MKFGYARVSTADQVFYAQVDALKAVGCGQIFQEKVSSGKERPQLSKLLEILREGDTLVVWELDRLGRSLKELLTLVSDFQTRGIGFISLNDSIDTTTAQGRLIFNLFASLAEFERDLIRERTKAGLSAARARGRIGGKKKGLTPDAIGKAETVKTLYQQGKRTDDIAKILQIGRATVYRYLEFMQVKRNQGT